MNFINLLPYQCKCQWVEENEKLLDRSEEETKSQKNQSEQPESSAQPNLEHLNSEDIERMRQFIAKWTKDDIRYAETIEYEEEGYTQSDAGLRELTMNSEDDSWFVENTIRCSKPEKQFKEYYKFMVMRRILTGPTLRKLHQSGHYRSHYLEEIEKKIRFTPILKQVLIDSYFEDVTAKVNYDIYESFKKMIMSQIEKIPWAVNQIQKRLIDPNLFKGREQEWRDLYLENFVCFKDNQSTTMNLFDKKTQQTFYRNLCDAIQMHSLDYTQQDSKYNPQLLKLMENLAIKEVQISQGDFKAEERIWISDYPILSYVTGDKRQIVMIHLADPDLPKLSLYLQKGQEFITFVDQYNNSPDALITFLIKTVDNKIVLRNCEYKNPYERKEFTNSNWSFEDQDLNMSLNVKNLLLERLRKVLLVERKDDQDEMRKGLMIQTQNTNSFSTSNSIFLFDFNEPEKSSQSLDPLVKRGCVVMLDVLRGVKDSYYIAEFDDYSTSLRILDITIDPQGRGLRTILRQESVHTAEKILAFEIDSSCTTDTASCYKEYSYPDKRKGDFDRIYLIDGHYNLLKIEVKDDNRIVSQDLLTKYRNVEDKIKQYIRNNEKEFMRISVSDRCLTFEGLTIYYNTGIYDFSNEVLSSENIPFSNLQIGFNKVRDKKQVTIRIKNEPGSRKQITFAHRQRNVLLFEMLSNDLMLVKLKGKYDQDNIDEEESMDDEESMNEEASMEELSIDEEAKITDEVEKAEKAKQAEETEKARQATEVQQQRLAEEADIAEQIKLAEEDAQAQEALIAEQIKLIDEEASIDEEDKIDENNEPAIENNLPKAPVQSVTNASESIYLATKEEFEAAIAATVGGKPLVIDYTATWCPPCKRIGPIYESHIPNYPELILKKLDIDANSEAAQQAEIRAMPTFKIYKNGSETDKMEGATDQGLIDLLNKARGENENSSNTAAAPDVKDQVIDYYLHTKEEFEDAVQATTNGKPLVIDFTATWCGPCKRIGPIYEGHIPNYPELTCKKVDVDNNSEATGIAEVRSMPTFKVYLNGVEFDKMEGASDQGLIDLLKKAKAAGKIEQQKKKRERANQRLERQQQKKEQLAEIIEQKKQLRAQLAVRKEEQKQITQEEKADGPNLKQQIRIIKKASKIAVKDTYSSRALKLFDYWTLMDTLGNIQDIPYQMKRILSLSNWTQIQSKQVNIPKDNESNQSQSGLLIALLAYDDQSPFPSIAGILLDTNSNKVLETHLTDQQAFIKDIELLKLQSNEEFNVKEFEQKFKDFANPIFIKTVITDKGEIVLIFSDPSAKTNLATEQLALKREIKSEEGQKLIKLKVMALHEVYKSYFSNNEHALYLQDTVFLKNQKNEKNEDNEIMCIEDKFDQKTQSTFLRLQVVKAPKGQCMLSQQSQFYRWRPSEATLSVRDLIFSQKLQLTYETSSLVVELDQLQHLVSDDKGYYDEFTALEFLFDPEHFVDSDIQLSKVEDENCWTHINSNVSRELYYLYQEEINEISNFTFLGLYRKFSEAELFELCDISEKEMKGERDFQIENLFASFYGNSILTIFFNNLDILQSITEQYERMEERMEFQNQTTKDNEDCEHKHLRLLYLMLSIHEIGKQSLSERMMISDDEQETQKQDSNEEKTNCNSLIYRSIYSEMNQNKDLILKLASFCEQFSLQYFFTSSKDIKKVLTHLSPQLIEALDRISVETSYTKKIKQLHTDQGVVCFWDDNYKLNCDGCQAKVNQLFKPKLVFKDTLSFIQPLIDYTKQLLNQNQDELSQEKTYVTVKMISSKNFQVGNEGKRNFNDELILLLNQTEIEKIISTKFVNAIFHANWRKYQQKIINTQLIPFILYLIFTLSFLVYALRENVERNEQLGPGFHCVYYPLFGCCMILTINQILKELYQCKCESENFWDYLTSNWNIIDFTYTSLNLQIMLMNLFDNEVTIYYQRCIAAVSVCFLWIKVIDWLRLFDGTAFYIKLIGLTLLSIKYFIIIMFVAYMMFGSAIYILNLGQAPEDQIMSHVFGFWALDAFLSQYELSLGEFQLEAYGESSFSLILIILFILSSFLIQVVLLNMMIAIMGDIFEQATANKENNRKLGQFKIMIEYINLAVQDLGEEQELPDSDDEVEQVRSNEQQVDKKMHGNKDYLYIVERMFDPSREEEGEWEGSIKSLKKFITKTEQQINKKIELGFESLSTQTVGNDELKLFEKNFKKHVMENQRELKAKLEKIQEEQMRINEMIMPTSQAKQQVVVLPQNIKRAESENMMIENDHGDMLIVDLEAYNSAVAATANGKPLVIYFTASWSAPCKRFRPVFKAKVAEHPQITMKMIDEKSNSQAAKAAGIQSIPTVMLFKNGLFAEKVEGATDQGLNNLLQKASER